METRDTLTNLLITAIFVLSIVELVCITKLWVEVRRCLKEQSDKRTDSRRAFFRARAYKDLAYKRQLKNNREMLFKAISKEVKR